jgi:hypothetical protein
MSPDTSLGDTLGRLGQSLTESLNPLNQFRAYDIQQQVWMRQQQLLQMQRENAARQAAIQMYAGIVPPDKLPGIALMIYQNAPQDQIMRQAAMWSDKLIDKTDPASIAHNIRFMESTGQKWTDPYPPYAGEVTGAYIRDLQAKQAGAVAGQQESGRIGATRSANAPLIASYIDQDTPEAIAHNLQVYQQLHNGDLPPDGLTPAVTPVMRGVHDAELAIRTATNEQATQQGKQNAINNLTGQYRDSTNPGDDAFNRRIYSALNNGAQFEPGLPVPVGDVTRAAYNKALGNRQETAAEAAERGKILGGGMDPTKPIFIPQLPPSNNVNLQPSAATPASAPAQTNPPTPVPVPAPAPAAPTASVQAPISKGATPDPNRPGWYWQGGQLHPAVTTGGPQGAVFGMQPGDLDVAKGANEDAAKTLTTAYAAGGDATRLKTITSQIRALERVSRTGGFVGQITAGPLRDLLDRAGLANVTTAQQAQTAEMNLLKNELPGVVKSIGMTRVAQPEIAAVGSMTGSADLPPGVLDNILANVDAGADYALQRKDLAGRVLGYGDPLNYPDFQQQDASLLANYSAAADQRRQSYGAIGTGNNNPPAAATASQPAGTWPDAITSLVHWLSGGGAASAPAPQPSTELDPNTGLPKGQ